MASHDGETIFEVDGSTFSPLCDVGLDSICTGLNGPGRKPLYVEIVIVNIMEGPDLLATGGMVHILKRTVVRCLEMRKMRGG